MSTMIRRPIHRLGIGPVASALSAALLLFVVAGCAGPSVSRHDSETSGGASIARSEAGMHLAGYWHAEQVQLFMSDGVTRLGPEEKAAVPGLSYRSERTNSLLGEESLTILYHLRPDGHYTCTTDWVDAPERGSTESGSWVLESGHTIRFDSQGGNRAFLSAARVMYVDTTTLLLRSGMTGTAGGVCKVVRLRQGVPELEPDTDSKPIWDTLWASSPPDDAYTDQVSLVYGVASSAASAARPRAAHTGQVAPQR